MLTSGMNDLRALYATLGGNDRLAYLDTLRPSLRARDQRWSELARRACETIPSELGAVTLVESDHVVILASWGWTSLPEEKTVSDAICAHAAALTRPIALEDARMDPLFRNHTLVRALAVVGYLGVPLPVLGRHAWGTLCVADRRVRAWSAIELQSLLAIGSGVDEMLD